MTERERVLALLRGETPDQVPWFGDLAYWYPYAMDKKIIDTKYAGDGLFQLHRDLGVGFYLQGYFPYRYVEGGGVQHRVATRGAEIFSEWTTPVGTLTQIETDMPESYTRAIRKHMIESLEDLKIFCYIAEHTRYEPNYYEAIRRKALVGDNGAVLCYTPKSPYMDMIALKMGIMTAVDVMSDEPDAFGAAMALLEESYDRAAELAVESPAEFLMIPENISSEVVGKRPYEQYMRRFHEKWNARIAQAGKVSFVHQDGTLRGLISELSSAGFRVLEAMTTGPVGDIDIEDLAGMVKSDTVLWGGLPGIYFTDLISDADFDAYVRRTLMTMTKAPRYVLGVADQVPPGSRPERIARVRTLVDRYGKYQ